MTDYVFLTDEGKQIVGQGDLPQVGEKIRMSAFDGTTTSIPTIYRVVSICREMTIFTVPINKGWPSYTAAKESGKTTVYITKYIDVSKAELR